MQRKISYIRRFSIFPEQAQLGKGGPAVGPPYLGCAYDITKLKGLPNMDNVKQIDLVFPIYARGAPKIMADFMKKLPKPHAFTSGVCA